MENEKEADGQKRTPLKRELFRSLIERSPLPMVTVAGLDHTVQYANPAFCSLLDKKCEDLIGRPFADAIPEAREYLEGLGRVARTGITETGTEEQQSGHHDGRWAYGLWAVIDAGRQPVGVMLHLSDETDAAHLRERLVALNQELMISGMHLHALSEERQLAQEDAEQANAAKDRFLAVVSHELRTPLTPVLAAVSMLQRNPHLDPATQDTLRTIRRNVEMEARLIDDLLDLTRIVQGKIRLEKQPVELTEIIASAVELCASDIRERQLEFEVDGPDSPYYIDADPARLQQVLTNLLKNSVKFTPLGGCVGIRCRRDGADGVVVEVNDSGRGIAPANLPRLFRPFEQGGAETTRRYGGLGLGLVISKSLVEQHGGSLEAHSEGEGKGATFRIRLPLLPTTPAADAAPAHPPKPQSRPLRVLYVEDHGDTAALMREMLEMEGHRVHTAGDVATALDTADREDFDVLVSDLGLPDGSGHDLVCALRARGWTCPAIALSGYGHQHNVRESHEAGFTLHLIKPVTIEKLLEALAQATTAAD